MNPSSPPATGAAAARPPSFWGRVAQAAASGLSRDELVRLLTGAHPFPRPDWWRSLAWRWLVRRLPVGDVFRLIHAKNIWSSAESVSGGGSTLQETQSLRQELPALLRHLQVQRLLDLPCGDFHWMSRVDLSGIDYLGADIVPELVAETMRRHGRPGVDFVCLDLISDPLPAADAVLCRDCLVHLPNALVVQALANLRRSGARYLLATSFPAHADNPDIEAGHWRPINLQAPPFGLPEPLLVVHEGSAEAQYGDKMLGVWRLDDLTPVPGSRPGHPHTGPQHPP